MKSSKFFLLFLLILVGVLGLSGCAGSAAFNNAVSWAGVSVEGQTVYAAYGNSIVAVSEGKLVWRYPETPEKNLFFFASPTISGDLLIAGSYNNEVHFIQKSDGKLDSRIIIPSVKSKIIASPVVADDIVLIASSDGILHAYELKGSHSEVWQTRLSSEIWTSPLVLDGKVYITSLDKKFNVLDLKTGKIEKTIDSNGAVMGGLVVADGRIYFGTFGKAVEQYDPSTGKMTTIAETIGEIWAQPLIIGEKLIVGDMIGNLYGFNLKSGESIWKIEVTGTEKAGIIANPIQLNDNLFLAISETGDLMTHDLDGSSINMRSTKSKILSNPVIMGETLITGIVPGDALLKAYSLDLKEDWIYVETPPTAAKSQEPAAATEEPRK